MWCNCKTPIKKYTITIESNNTDYWTIDVDEKEVWTNCEISANGNQLTIGGTTITATPKVDTSEYDYEFEGWYVNWTKIVEPIYVEGEMTIEANFTRVLQPYTVTFYWDGGEVLQTSRYSYWDTPVYSWATPTKQSTVWYTYTFSWWNPAIHTVEWDQEYTAVFTETFIGHTITFEVIGESCGWTGTVSPQSIVVPNWATWDTATEQPEIIEFHWEDYYQEVTAIPDQWSLFLDWEAPVGSDEPITQDYTFTAHVTDAITVTFVANPVGWWTVSEQSLVVPNGTSCWFDSYSPGLLRLSLDCYAEWNVTATPSQGNVFYGWTTSWWDLPQYWDLSEDTTITANFGPELCTVTFSARQWSGSFSQQSVTVPKGTQYSAGSYEDVMTLYTSPDETTITAIPAAWYRFSMWNSTDGTINSNTTITADFEPDTYTVTFAVDPAGWWTVSQQSITVPAGTSYEPACYGSDELAFDTYPSATTIYATSAEWYNFTWWSSDEGTVNSNMTITANFAAIPYTITFQPYMEEQDGGWDLIWDGWGTCSPSSVEVSSWAHATTSWNTMTIIDPIYWNTTVTFAIAQDTAQYEYFDPEFHYYNYEGEYGQETDYTYEYLTEGSWIDRDWTVWVRLYRRTKSYDVYVSEGYSHWSWSESYSQRDDPYKYYGTTWTVNGNTITFSDGSSVTATPDSGSYFWWWYTDYEWEYPLSASWAVTWEMSIYAQYWVTHTITFQPYMVDHDTWTFIENWWGTCSPSSVVVTKDARATVNWNTMTVTDPVFGNTNVVFTIAQDTAQYEYEFNDFREYDDPDYWPDSTYYYLIHGSEEGISGDWTVWVEVIRTEIFS